MEKYKNVQNAFQSETHFPDSFAYSGLVENVPHRDYRKLPFAKKKKHRTTLRICFDVSTSTMLDDVRMDKITQTDSLCSLFIHRILDKRIYHS